jgi:hypothetical protein
MEPVDMESVEREHYLKTGQVLKTRHVEARPSRIKPGCRLSQVIGMHVIENLDSLNTEDLGVFLGALAASPINYVFHRDFKKDAQFIICKKLMSMTDEDVGKIIIPVCLALSKFEPTLEIPNRVWSRKVIPVLRRGVARVDLIVPAQYKEWNHASLWALLVSLVVSSGRVRLSNRVIQNYLFNQLAPGICPEAISHLVQASVISGVPLPEGITKSIICRSDIPVETIANLADQIDVGDVVVSRLVELDAVCPTDSLAVLNAIMSSTLVDKLTPEIERLVTKIAARTGTTAIDSLGKIGTVLDSSLV